LRARTLVIEIPYQSFISAKSSAKHIRPSGDEEH
jgi:hypothetical protein